MEMMLKTYKQYKELLINHEKIKDDVVIHKSPKWERLDNFAETHWSTLLWTTVYLGTYYFLQVEAIYYILIPIHFLVGPIQGAIVNWFGHKVGYRNFKTKDQSRNTLAVDFALMGELYQNNHHRYGQKLNFAHRWFEIDLTYQFSRILIFLGVIKLQKDEL